jgi:DNA-binding NarL/FixJ family response regulator
MRVLIVDDASSVRERIRAALREIADVVEVTEAATGEQALTAVAEFRPDLITLDLRLPGMSGLDVLKSLRSSDRPVRVAIITNYADPELQRHSLDLGADHFFSKTTNLVDILRAVLGPTNGKGGTS